MTAAKLTDPLTSELHVRNNDLLADARERVLVLKQLLVVCPLTDRCQELDGIANQLKQTNRWILNTECHKHTSVKDPFLTKSYLTSWPVETKRLQIAVTKLGRYGWNSSSYFCAYRAALSHI